MGAGKQFAKTACICLTTGRTTNRYPETFGYPGTGSPQSCNQGLYTRQSKATREAGAGGQRIKNSPTPLARPFATDSWNQFCLKRLTSFQFVMNPISINAAGMYVWFNT